MTPRPTICPSFVDAVLRAPLLVTILSSYRVSSRVDTGPGCPTGSACSGIRSSVRPRTPAQARRRVGAIATSRNMWVGLTRPLPFGPRVERIRSRRPCGVTLALPRRDCAGGDVSAAISSSVPHRPQFRTTWPSAQPPSLMPSPLSLVDGESSRCTCVRPALSRRKREPQIMSRLHAARSGLHAAASEANSALNVVSCRQRVM